MAARRLTPSVSASRCRSAPRGVAEAQRGQPLPGRLGGQPHVGVGEPGHRRQQRPVEDPLVQPAHLALLGPPLRDDRLGGRRPVPQGTTQPPQVALGRGHEVRAPQPVAAGCGAPACAAAGRPCRASRRRRARRSRRRRARRAPSRVVPVRSDSSARPCTSWSSCTENSTSRRPPGPSLIWRSASAAGMCCSTRRRIACTSSTKFSRLERLPHHRLHRVAVRLPDPGVAGDRPRLEQRLELPGLGPALVVGAVAGDRAHQRPVLALGPQGGVDLPERPGRRSTPSRSASAGSRGRWRAPSTPPRPPRRPAPPRR